MMRLAWASFHLLCEQCHSEYQKPGFCPSVSIAQKRLDLHKPLLNHISFQGEWTDYAVKFLHGFCRLSVRRVALISRESHSHKTSHKHYREVVLLDLSSITACCLCGNLCNRSGCRHHHYL